MENPLEDEPSKVKIEKQDPKIPPYGEPSKKVGSKRRLRKKQPSKQVVKQRAKSK